ncbi:hypothetical protein [Streptomyces sp. NEAU-W12]|uniref:hypothetical protein n=1 Tax=Streptomyces sp. NEAU-W12 TaxID=2994668 RepID=UPI00224B0AEF|nr:hypothetical protein [Streptomyces sp. NEAU-W12]MCX2927068.1 hypothetical protein [Streptomyces sp. NEAU-W12]
MGGRTSPSLPAKASSLLLVVVAGALGSIGVEGKGVFHLGVIGGVVPVAGFVLP